MSFNNRQFNPNIWDQPRAVHPIPPFANNPPNFYNNQSNAFQFQNNFNQNFSQNKNIRPLLGLPTINQKEHNQPFRKFNNNHNQDNYRRPGPACARNNNFNSNNQRWNKNQRQDDFNNRGMRKSDTFENHNNNNNFNRPPPPPPENNDQPTSSGSDTQKFTSLVEHLKAVQSLKKSDAKEIDAMCAKNASEASKKLMTQIKTMDKGGVRELINNPKQPYKKKVLNIQAREKLREQMRKKLKKLGDEGDGNDFGFEPDECIDYEKLPETLIAQIGKTIDMNLETEEMDFSDSINEGSIEDRDLEVVKKNLGNDFLFGSEMLLMNGFSLLAETDESEVYNNAPKPPPLPTEKPPSPPPEPVPPPSDEMVVQPAFSSVEKPWSPVPKLPVYNERLNDVSHKESARNPDPPGFENIQIPVENVIEDKNRAKNFVEEKNLAKIVTEEKQICSLPEPSAKPIINEDDEWDRAPSFAQATSTEKQYNEAMPSEYHREPNESGQRANETYGDYRRRLIEEQKNTEIERPTSSASANGIDSNISNNKFNNSQQKVEHFKHQNESNPRNSNERFFNRGGPKDRNNWMSNRNSSRQDQQQNRKSRYDTPRTSEQKSNNFQRRNLSRDTNNSHDSGGRFDEVKDVHNYRVQNESNSTEPKIDNLNSLLNPKPLQFKGSFNKRNQNSTNFNQSGSNWNINGTRSRSRNRTPTKNPNEFNDVLLPSENDVRPCLSTLRRVMEIDTELMRLHDKIHGIDKVILNLQSERVGYQKSCTELQQNRKVLFENMMKRAMSNTDENDSPQKESSYSKERSKEPIVSGRAAIEKKLQNIVDQKKRKRDEQHEEPKKKKQIAESSETTSAAEKALRIQKQREEEERIQRVIEKKRLKKLRKQREEGERLRLEEKNRQEAIATTKIKVEPVEKVKTPVNQKPEKSSKHEKQMKETRKTLFMKNDIIQSDNNETKQFCIRVARAPVTQSYIDTFNSSGLVEIELSDWQEMNKIEVKIEKEATKIKEEKIPEKERSKSPEVIEDPLAMAGNDQDPLAIDDTSMNPPTPGSNLDKNEESMLIEIQTEQDYSEWTGNFGSHDHPIVHLQIIFNKFVICATEGGKLYKYHIDSGKLAAVFSKHTEICNSFLYDAAGSIYTISSDGFLHKIKFKTFQLMSSENFNEPLQVIEKSKAGIYVGTKGGKIFKLKNDLTERESEPICELGVLILCMRATKEGSRNILLVSSRSHAIQVRDASDGLLLRTLSDNLAGVSIYDMLIEGSTIYCGSNRTEIFAIDFTTGALKKSLPCGAGTICVKLFKNYLIAACYDGNIYIFNIKNNDAAVNICGPSNMLLAMDLWNDKIVATTKDKTLKIMNIPT